MDARVEKDLVFDGLTVALLVGSLVFFAANCVLFWYLSHTLEAPWLTPLIYIWVGMFAPAGTPAAIVDRLNREVNAIAASSDMASVLEPDGTQPEAISATMFAGRIKEELNQWKQIATEHKIVAE